MKAINPTREISVDEAIYSFFSLHHEVHNPVDCQIFCGDPAVSPQRYIPRKPHPNGLLSYLAGLKLASRPFMIWIAPDAEAACALWKRYCG